MLQYVWDKLGRWVCFFSWISHDLEIETKYTSGIPASELRWAVSVNYTVDLQD